MTKSFLTEYRLELGCLLGLLFAFLTIAGVVEVWVLAGTEDDPNILPSYLSWLGDLSSPLGDWATWAVIIAPIGLIACVWWLYDYVKKTRELAKLIDTPSKAKFVRNMDDIEYLAWVLPKRYENQVIDKKKEFKL